LESKRNYDIERLFKPYLWAHYNFGSPFNVRYFSSLNNQEYSKSFTGITQSEFDSLFSSGTNTNQQYQYWTLEVFNNDKIALIDVNTFGNTRLLDRFRSFLDSSFTIIKQKGIRELIIDVRNNSGGETELVEALIDYTANKPWTAFSRADYKFSDQAKADLIPWYLRWVPIKPFINLFSFMYTSAKIDKAEYDLVDNRLLHVYMKPGKLKANPLRYSGDTYLLINSGSYSASVIFAAIMKDYGFATLVGEETGQPANPYGGSHFFFLPNTHLLACVPTGRCYRPSGIETNHGVLTDFEVRKSFNTITSQKDTVLEFTKELIKKNIKAGVSQ
jgi:C-terminal processing protease CtpA/Prc